MRSHGHHIDITSDKGFKTTELKRNIVIWRETDSSMIHMLIFPVRYKYGQQNAITFYELVLFFSVCEQVVSASKTYHIIRQ